MGYLIGTCLACYFLIGRWNFLRLEGEFDNVEAIDDPRVWLIGIAAAAVLLLSCFNYRGWWLRFQLQRVDAAILVFLVYMLITALWAPDAELAMLKAYEVNLLIAVAVIVTVTRQREAAVHLLSGFFFTLLVIGGAMAFYAIYQSTGGRIAAPGGGPNTFGRNMGLTAIAALYFAARPGVTITTKISAAIMVVMALLLVMMCGSRGGLMSACMGAMTIILLSRTSLARKVLILTCLILLGAAALFYTPAGQNALDVFEHRIVEQTIENRYMSSRDDLWEHAVELAQVQPIAGLGLNGYQANSWTYPHNMVLEVWVEGGTIGVVLLAFAGFVFFRDNWRSRNRVSSPALAAFVLAFVAAQSSGDLYDSRGVFLLMAMITPVVLQPTATIAAQARRTPAVGASRPAIA